jgi:hypothetical protein
MLDEFCAEHARKERVKDWLDAHNYQDAMPEDQDAV